MIKNLKFNNFKCLSGKDFSLSKINFFTGYNGRGKSSVIQSLLLLSQSTRKNEVNSIENLHLNGKFVQLGDFDELIFDEDNTSFGIEMSITNGSEHSVKLAYEMTNDYKVGHLCGCEIDGSDLFDTPGSISHKQENEGTSIDKELTNLPNFINEQFLSQNVHYVAADRIGPMKFVEKEEKPEHYNVGANGSKTVNTLSDYTEVVVPSMNVSALDTNAHSLNDATTQWIEYIMQGGSVSVKGRDSHFKEKKEKSAVLELEFGMKDRAFTSYNVGFGYSYILSIIVTALIAKEGNIVIIENPEAHLHPEAQVRLTYLLAKLAARNVQVFVETHSEHVINGIRLAILKSEYNISNSDVSIFFFDYDYSKTDLKIEKNGRISNWPARFFDQYQHELAEIMKLGASVK